MPGTCKDNRSNWELIAPGTSRESALAREAHTALSAKGRQVLTETLGGEVQGEAGGGGK